MLDAKYKKRIVKRDEVSIPAVVTGRESIYTFWKEVTDIFSISRLGAGFKLHHKCSAGRILPLVLDMPKIYRCYDWDQMMYRVWAVVQYCNPVVANDAEGFHIGVAFVGKDPPKSYLENPLKPYIISGMSRDGFWNIEETKIPLISRAYPRYSHSVKTRLATIDPEGKETAVDNKATVKNISVGGTAVFSDLKVEIGDCVRFTCEEYNFSSICLVRNRQKKEGERITLHLSFSEIKFPVEEVNTASQILNELEDLEELKTA